MSRVTLAIRPWPNETYLADKVEYIEITQPATAEIL